MADRIVPRRQADGWIASVDADNGFEVSRVCGFEQRTTGHEALAGAIANATVEALKGRIESGLTGDYFANGQQNNAGAIPNTTDLRYRVGLDSYRTTLPVITVIKWGEGSDEDTTILVIDMPNPNYVDDIKAVMPAVIAQVAEAQAKSRPELRAAGAEATALRL